jgi:uncharacterized membrane protein YfcA
VIVAQFVTNVPTQTFYLVLGVPVVILSVIQLAGRAVSHPRGATQAGGMVVGLAAGILGGLTGTWGPPTVLYLIALETPKAKQILVQGVVYGLGRSACWSGMSSPAS